MGKAPVLYVHGNHDTGYDQTPPEGCDCIDDQILVYNGIRILGLGGCRRYHPGKYQYTEAQMRRRIAKLRWRLWRLKGVDIVVTHAAPEGLGDDEDKAHWGFPALVDLMDQYKPKFLVHGHVHMSYGHHVPREIDYNGTKIINAYERYTIEIPEGSYRPRDWKQVIYKTRLPREQNVMILK
jgi:Icc-related predicted phosphoesterase